MKIVPILVVLAAVAGPSSQAVADGNSAAGEIVAKRCAACHTLEKGEANKVGPNLGGVVGRKPGIVASFAYSPSYAAMAAKGVVWDEPALFAYLFDPQKFVKEKTGDPAARSRMTFVLKSEQERADVIAFLKTK